MGGAQQSANAVGAPEAGTVAFKLEVVVIPVSDVDRSKHFYGSLGWRLDADITAGDAFRVQVSVGTERQTVKSGHAVSCRGEKLIHDPSRRVPTHSANLC